MEGALMETEMPEELPAGYALLASPDNRLVWILKDGKILHRTARKHQCIGPPIWFYAVDRAHAIRYAREHFQLRLSPDMPIEEKLKR
jgi:hypothetical protein